ncbi:hypothetical protein PHLGIDRAFT_327989 [Phlebiopsis gigantea 11061_1 CR5-6]|uniref:F-box domain-containing protein n=1 Tax=Phlebiopsis gigantea (strain 11061_1 CR5-6) TaxID=745531 RepID=A0A0C3SDY4_PHLG1|nr:hypothetical protein PHLGIDRAFT_327989 [Phlebiopsis gigantea 11061_1 CR5-6]
MKAEKENKPAAAASTSSKQVQGKRVSDVQASPLKKLREDETATLITLGVKILLEVFLCLEPKDLINVSYTCAALCRTLLSVEHRFVWERALEKAVPSAPDCPRGISLPAYCELLFVERCHFCRKSRVHTIAGECLLRACKECRENEQNFAKVNESYMPLPFPPGVLVKDIAPIYRLSKDRNPVLYVPRIRWAAICERMDVLSIQEDRLQQTGEDYGQDVEEKRKLLVTELSEFKRLRKAFARELEGWSREHKRLEKDHLQSRRLVQILERIAETSGDLSAEVHLLDDSARRKFQRLAQTKKSRLLVDKEWAIIHGPVVQHLQDTRATRLSKQRAEPHIQTIRHIVLHLDALASFHADRFVAARPTIADLCLHPGVKSAVIAPILEAAQAHHDPLPDIGHGMGGVIELAIKGFVNDAQSVLRKIAAKGICSVLRDIEEEELGEHVGLEELPHVWFACKNCGCDTMTASQTYQHRCLRLNHKTRLEPQSSDDDLVNALGEVSNNSEDTVVAMKKHITFNSEVFEKARRLLSVAPLQVPLNLSVDYPDGRGVEYRAACRNCEYIMTWRRALVHRCELGYDGELGYEDRSSMPAMELVSSQVAANTKILEGQQPRDWRTAPTLFCVYCAHWDPADHEAYTSIYYLEQHLADTHGIKRKSQKYNDYVAARGEAYWDAFQDEPGYVSFADFQAALTKHPLDEAHKVLQPNMTSRKA